MPASCGPVSCRHAKAAGQPHACASPSTAGQVPAGLPTWPGENVKELDYVAASRALGASHVRILLVRILPNALTPIVVLATLGIASAILDAAGLSFLGLGAQPPTPEWGTMLGSERNQVFSAPHLVFYPGIAIMLTKELDYVAASRALGASHVRILLVRILPNALTPIVVLATLGIASAILDAAGLSFLGLGAQPPTPEWGTMLGSERNQVFSAPHLVFYPGIAIMLTVLGFNLLGDGLRDSLDPRLND